MQVRNQVVPSATEFNHATVDEAVLANTVSGKLLPSVVVSDAVIDDEIEPRDAASDAENPFPESLREKSLASFRSPSAAAWRSSAGFIQRVKQRPQQRTSGFCQFSVNRFNGFFGDVRRNF